MKKIITKINHIKILSACFVCSISTSMLIAQTIPQLGDAERFGILSGKGVTSTDTAIVRGDIGVVDFTSDIVKSTGLIFESGECIVSEAITDLDVAKQQAKAQSGTLLSNTLANITLTSGVFEAISELRFQGDVTLSGSSSSVFIFNINEQLIIEDSARILLSGVEPENVFFNVEKEVIIGKNTVVKGIIMAEKTISLDESITDECRLLCKDTVRLVKVDTLGTTIKIPSQIELGAASSFAVLSGGSITSLETTRILTGNVGALGNISSDIITDTSNLKLSGNFCETQQSLSDLKLAKSAANMLAGTSLSTNLGGLTLNQGVYEINGDAIVDGILTLTGDSSSVFIFNVSGSFTLNSDVSVNLINVLPQNVYWNVGGNVNINTGVYIDGIIMANSSINLSLPYKRYDCFIGFR